MNLSVQHVSNNLDNGCSSIAKTGVSYYCFIRSKRTSGYKTRPTCERTTGGFSSTYKCLYSEPE